MSRVRSLATHTPAIVISVLALALSLSGGAYAAAAAHDKATSSATGVTWTALTLSSGWESASSVNSSGDPRAAVQNGIVYLTGGLTQPTPGSDIVTTLAKKFRPAHTLWIAVATSNGTTGQLYIAPNGTFEAYSNAPCNSGNAAQCFTSLAGVSFPKSS